jgi:hypothetical protein
MFDQLVPSAVLTKGQRPLLTKLTMLCCGVLWCAVVCCGVLWCAVVCCGVLCCCVSQVTQLGHVKDLADAFMACVGNPNAERQVGLASIEGVG